jgi:hypothetical protein
MAGPWEQYQSTDDSKPWEKYQTKPEATTIYRSNGMGYSSMGGPAPELNEGDKITPHGLVRPVLEMGGFALGSTAGPVGAGAGYAGGRQLANIYEAATGTNEKPLPTTIKESAIKTGKEMAVDVPVGIGMEYLGKYATPVFNAGLKKLGTLAEGISKYIAKPSKGIPIEDVNTAIRKGLSNRVPLSEKGAEQATQKIVGIENQIDQELESVDATAQLLGKNIDNKKVLERLGGLKERYGDSINKVDNLKKINDYESKFLEEHGAEQVPSKAQAMKKQTYAELTAAKKTAYSGMQPLDIELQKQTGRGLKETLGELWEPIKHLNKDQAEWITLKKIINGAVARERNKYPFGLMETTGGVLGGVIGERKGGASGAGEGAIAGALLIKALRSPGVMQQIAFTLYKIGQKSAAKTAVGKGAGLVPLSLTEGNQDIQPRAAGGPVNPNQPYLVGEKGPEVIVPQQPGTVIPNQLTPQQPQQQQQNQNWGNREDGTPKGNGWLGVLQRPDGKVSTEISIGVNINGKETEIPTLVPTLTKEEVNYLLTNNPEKQDLFDTPMGKSIMKKAYDHALEQIRSGKSPFKQESMAAPNQLMAQQAPQQQPQQKIPIGQPGDPRAVPLIQLQKQLKDAAVKDDWNEVDRLNKLIQKVQATG